MKWQWKVPNLRVKFSWFYKYGRWSIFKTSITRKDFSVLSERFHLHNSNELLFIVRVRVIENPSHSCNKIWYNLVTSLLSALPISISIFVFIYHRDEANELHILYGVKLSRFHVFCETKSLRNKLTSEFTKVNPMRNEIRQWFAKDWTKKTGFQFLRFSFQTRSIHIYTDSIISDFIIIIHVCWKQISIYFVRI